MSNLDKKINTAKKNIKVLSVETQTEAENLFGKKVKSKNKNITLETNFSSSFNKKVTPKNKDTNRNDYSNNNIDKILEMIKGQKNKTLSQMDNIVLEYYDIKSNLDKILLFIKYKKNEEKNEKYYQTYPMKYIFPLFLH